MIKLHLDAEKNLLQQFSEQQSKRAEQEPLWLTDIREQAQQNFQQLGLPHRKVENWKYTNVSKLVGKGFQVAAINAMDSIDITPYMISDLDCYRIVLINGQLIAEHSDLDLLKDNVTVNDLATAFATSGNSIEEYFDKVVDYTSQPFASLNSMFFNNGLLLEVAKNAILDKPIHIINISQNTDADLVSYLRNLWLIGKNSQVDIIESHHATDDSCHFVNALSEIVLQDNARCTHYKTHFINQASYHVAGIHIAQQRDSYYEQQSFALSGELVRNDIQVRLQDLGAECKLNGLYRAEDNQHIDYHIIVDHQKPHGTSIENFKGIMDGSGHGVFNGKVIVRPDAQKSDAQQMNKNLLLTKRAEVDTKPELEIYADDVKCSHGSTVGQLDEDALFYLQSRGFNAETAKNLLVYGFASDLINEVSIQPLQQLLKQEILSHLPLVSHFEELV